VVRQLPDFAPLANRYTLCHRQPGDLIYTRAQEGVAEITIKIGLAK
jgi:hypothetical protein